MNTNHYPSLELCKKLTEIGFPRTENGWKTHQDTKKEYLTDNQFGFCKVHAPSVMEMFDILYPKRSLAEILTRWEKQMGPNRMGEHANMPLPDFLANEIIWLHENNYLSLGTSSK